MKTIKKSLFLLVFLFPIFLFSQPIPAWLFPIYFEDSIGAKDTVYIGYDPSSQIYIDTQFNENFILVDTSKMNVYFRYSTQFGGCAPSIPDSVTKTYIQGDFFLNDYYSYGWGFCFAKTKLPLKMKWNPILLYNDSLPFSDITPRPRARIDYECSISDPPCYKGADLPYSIITDYADTNWSSQNLYLYSDSMVFSDTTIYPSPPWDLNDFDGGFKLSFYLVPHDAPLYSGIKKIVDEYLLLIYPNPFSDQINIINNNSESLKITIFNSVLQSVFSSYIQHNQEILIDMSMQSYGIYFVQIKNKNDYSLVKKIFKSY